MDDLHGMPNWLNALVRGKWTAAEWKVWDEDWLTELERRGITPDMLDPVGNDFSRPDGISVRTPEGGRCSARVDWDADERQAVLYALQRLVDELDRPGDPEPPRTPPKSW